jgi:uncharacterized Zn finger protein
MDIKPGASGAGALAAEEEAPPEPLPTDADLFWKGGAEEMQTILDLNVPTASAALPKRLGPFPFWRGRETLLVSLEKLYHRASKSQVDDWRDSLEGSSLF